MSQSCWCQCEGPLLTPRGLAGGRGGGSAAHITVSAVHVTLVNVDEQAMKYSKADDMLLCTGV